MNKALMVAILLCLLASCGPAITTPPDDGEWVSEAYVSRYIDAEAGVVCWIVSQGGVSCLPIGDTRLDE